MKKIVFFKRGLYTIVFIAIVSLCLLSCNNAKDSHSAVIDNKSDSIKANKDAQFLTKAAEINLEEIQMGQLAQQNGIMSEIKELGRVLVDDHTKSWNELVVLARKKSITIPTSMDDNAQNDYKKLSAKAGNDFDKEFCDMMVRGHKDAISLFEKESGNADDSDIRQWASATLPALHKHLNDAMVCQQKFN